MNPNIIIKKYFEPGSESFRFLVEHGKSVAKKALEAAKQVKHLNPDIEFIKEASMLHDIGICMVLAPEIGCFGDNPYICHGYLGRELLDKENLPRHGMVCERHVGVGITIDAINSKKLPLPLRDMQPVTVEEEIVCFADKFFSKDPQFLTKEKPLELIRAGIRRFGEKDIERFDGWLKKYGYSCAP